MTNQSLLVFADDWGRHPSSAQHLIRELLPTHRVWWVNTIGTRPIRFDRYTLERGFEKLASWRRAKNATPAALPKNLEVLQPKMWPSFASSLSRGINRRLLARAITRAMGDANPVAITTIPVVADLVGVIPVKKWIYYCVDDFGEWPGLDKQTLQSMERDLVSKVDSIVAVSEHLQHRLQDMGRESTLLTHGVDLEYWKQLGQSALVDGREKPIILFWGLLDARLDMNRIAALNEKMTFGSLVFVGPENNLDDRLRTLDRVTLLGPQPFEELPKLAASASVLIMPYADLPATRAMQPLKLKEYLATGKPVVVSDLPANREWWDACDVVASAEQFAARVLDRIESGLPSTQSEARMRLSQESWKEKARHLSQLWHSGGSP